jgi:flagellar basal-body rod modification protein FlgD
MVWSDVTVSNGTTTSNTESTTISSTGKNTESSSNSVLDVDDFLMLLCTELQYQDPLEPTDNSDYIAQMATFTQVAATNDMLDSVSRQTASNLVGKTVIMNTDLNTQGYVAGTVDYWEVISGTIYLGIEGKLYDLADLDTVMDDSYYEQWSDQ